MIFAIAGGDSYLGKSHPLTFRPYYDIPASSNAILTEFKKESGNSAPTVDFVEPDDDLGHSLSGKAAAYAEQLGYNSNVIYLSRSSTDYTPTATKVVGDHPDIIDFGPTPGDQYGPFIKVAQQQGYKGVFSFPDTLDSTTVAKSVPMKDIAGSLTAPAWTSFPSPAGKFFSTSVKKQVDSVQGWTAQAFDNILLFKAAVEKAGSLDPHAIATALGQVSAEGALGHVSYGGTDTYGLPQIIEIPYPVDKVNSSGDLADVAQN
jgi:branched-chain amino acid transport system substrate-binding protein